MQQIIDALLSPLTFLYDIVLSLSLRLSNSYVLSLCALALFQYFIYNPFKSMGRKFKEQELAVRSVLDPQIAAIEKNISAQVRHEKIRTIYQRYNYHPLYAVRYSAEVLIQLPFFLAAYSFLSDYSGFKGKSISFVPDLSQPDQILFGLNLLPLIMTTITLAAAFLTPGLKASEKRTAAIISILFLVLLYNAPSALVVFWIANNIVSFCSALGRKELIATVTRTVELFERYTPKNSIQIGCSSLVIYFLCSYIIHPNKDATYVQKYLSIAFATSALSLFLHVIRKNLLLNWRREPVARKGILILALTAFVNYVLDRFFVRSGRSFFGSYETLKLLHVTFTAAYFASNLSLLRNFSAWTPWKFPSYRLLFPLLVSNGVVMTFFLANLKAVSDTDVLIISLALFSSVLLLNFIFISLKGKFSAPEQIWYIFSICFLLIFYRPTLVAVLKTPVELSLPIQILVVSFVPLIFISLEAKFRGFLLYAGSLFLVASILTGARLQDNPNSLGVRTIDYRDERANLVPSFKKKPNIYLLIYDSYVHNSQLKEYGLENDQQEKFLEENGFIIYRNTYTGSIPASIASMSGVLDVAFSAKKGIPENNLVNEVLKREGYNTQLVLSAYFFRGINGLPAYNIFPEPSKTWLTSSFKNGVLHGEHKFNFSVEQTDYFEWLAKKRSFLSGKFDRPQFMYSHSNLPSHTQNSGVCLPTETSDYGARLREANIEMKADLANISEGNRDSLVIIAGDHGPYLTGDCTTLNNIEVRDISRADLLDRHGVFLAIRWPSGLQKPERLEGYVLQELFSLVFDALTGSTVSPRPVGDNASWREDARGQPPIIDGIVNWGRDKGKPLYK